MAKVRKKQTRADKVAQGVQAPEETAYARKKWAKMALEKYLEGLKV